MTAFDRCQTRRFLAKSRPPLLRKGVTRIRLPSDIQSQCTNTEVSNPFHLL